MEKPRTPAVNIRDFQTKDYPHILKIWGETGMIGTERNDDHIVIDQTLQSGGKFFVMLHKDTMEMIGTAWITNNNRRLYIHHFCIKPKYQNMGLGYHLGLHCLEFARQKKMQIKLEVHHTNTAALRLYRKLGFKSLEGYEVLINRNP